MQLSWPSPRGLAHADAAAMGFYFINICLLNGTKRDSKKVVVLSDAPDVNTGRLRAMPLNSPTLDWELTPGVTPASGR